ncbi:MAG: LytR/AlgR family response regulator transcription factor [Crocinitomicaceae bacterium]
MRALVVDNETEIRNSVVELIGAFCPDITEIGEAVSVETGIAKIQEFKPDVLFLDVELGDGTGMDLLSKLGPVNFPVIFITAHNKYAVDAFRFSAIDFLLKPIDPEELMRSVDRIKSQTNNHLSEQIQVLKDMISNNLKIDKKIVLRDSASIYFVKVADIIRCESDRSYTTFILNDGKKIVVSKGIKDYEEILEPNGFIRTHQSHLVNTSKIVRFDKIDGGALVMENGDQVPVSQRKKEEVIELLGSL